MLFKNVKISFDETQERQKLIPSLTPSIFCLLINGWIKNWWKVFYVQTTYGVMREGILPLEILIIEQKQIKNLIAWNRLYIHSYIYRIKCGFGIILSFCRNINPGGGWCAKLRIKNYRKIILYISTYKLKLMKKEKYMILV